MKKWFKILLILFLFLSCYLIYITTENNTLNYVAIGCEDRFNYNLINDKNIEYNNLYVDSDYRIIELLNIIKYNEEKNVSIHYLLNRANILTIDIGMNELYAKLKDNTRDIYIFLNTMIVDMHYLLSEINKYEYDKVFVMGYYNIDKKNNDIFTYINYKLNDLVKRYGYSFIHLNGIIDETDLIRKDHFKLNEKGIDKINKIILAYLEKS